MATGPAPQVNDWTTIPQADDWETVTPGGGHGASGSWEPGPKQSRLLRPVFENDPGYKQETEKLRSIAAPATSVAQAEEDVKHPIKSGVRRFLAGSEADAADLLTPLFAGTAAVGAASEAPGIVGTIARTASRAGAAGFGAKGALDVAETGTQNTPDAWARRLSGLGQVVASPAALKFMPAQNREARMSSGAGLTQGEEALRAITPELDTTLKSQGNTEVKSIGEFQSLVRDTNGRLENEYRGALKPIAKTRLNTQPIADAIANEITPNMLNTRDGQLMAKALWQRAREFDSGKPWTVEELDLEREKLAKSYRDAKPSDVAADLKLKARQIADRAANKAVNDLLYSMADQSAGKPAGYFKALKQKQSTLFDMADDVKAEKDSVTAGSAQGKGKLLREVISPRSLGHPKTGAIREGAKVVANKLIDPLETANTKVRMAFAPAPRNTAPGRASTVSAAAEGAKGPAPRRPMTTDEYSDENQLRQ
jgi:hypothetical protein